MLWFEFLIEFLNDCQRTYSIADCLLPILKRPGTRTGNLQAHFSFSDLFKLCHNLWRYDQHHEQCTCLQSSSLAKDVFLGS